MNKLLDNPWGMASTEGQINMLIGGKSIKKFHYVDEGEFVIEFEGGGTARFYVRQEQLKYKIDIPRTLEGEL